MKKVPRRVLSILLSILLLGSSVSVCFAADHSSEPLIAGEWEYEIIEWLDNSVGLTNYLGENQKVIEIPETIDGKAVIGWSYDTFDGLSDYEFVIPSTWPESLFNAYVHELENEGLDDEESLKELEIGVLMEANKELLSIAANKFTVRGNNKHFTSVDGVLYSKDMTTLVKYPICRKDSFFSLPDSIDLWKMVSLYEQSHAASAFAVIDEALMKSILDSRSLTMHISARQLQKLYNQIGSDTEALWDMVTELTDVFFGVSKICSDWSSPSIEVEGKRCDWVRLNALYLDEEDIGEYAFYYPHFEQCKGHSESKIKGFFQKIWNFIQVVFSPVTTVVRWLLSLFGLR